MEPVAVPVWSLGDRLRKAREAAGFGQQEFAERTSLARATISAAENGRRVPSRANLRLWAVAAGVPYEWLVTGEAPAEVAEVAEDAEDADAPAEDAEDADARRRTVTAARRRHPALRPTRRRPLRAA